MKFFSFLILFIIILCSLKLINYFLELKQKSISKKIVSLRKNCGYLSIKDLNSIDFNNLLKLINTYLTEKGYKDIIFLKDSPDERPTLICYLNEEAIFVSLQTYINNELTSSKNSYMDIFIANMLKHECKKGIIFTNFTFNNDDILAINKFNKTSPFNIQLVDGYELSRFVRHLEVFKEKERKNA